MSLNVKGHRHMQPAFSPQPRNPLLPVQRKMGPRQFLWVSKEVRFVPQYEPGELGEEPKLIGYRIDVQTKGDTYRDVLERALWKSTRLKGAARKATRVEAARLGAARG